MNYQELWREDNNKIRERYDLAVERISRIPAEETVEEPFRAYFRMMASFTAQIEALVRLQERGELELWTMDQLKDLNHMLYRDILPEHYETSYANPAYAAASLGDSYGQKLSFLYEQMRGAIVFAYESRLTEITILCETFIELYNLFEEGKPSEEQVRDVLYWFVSDYTDVTLTYRVREGLDPSLSFAKDIIMECNLEDLRYLYRYGEYISEGELKLARFLNSLPEETVKHMADTYTEGYRKGFEVMGRDLSKKSTVVIRYDLGFERMVRCAIANFRELGLEPVIYRAPVWSVNRRPNNKVGYHGTSPNRQYDYDHRYDSALYLDKAFKDRKLAVLRVAYETYKKEAAQYAGPAVVETFGEEGFSPVNKPEACRLSKKQEELTIAYANESMQIINQYIPGEETSFTIIAFPVPEIGEEFEEIFRETVRINTLDYEQYKIVQQAMIDVLDQASYVTVTGARENRTDLRVSLHKLSDPQTMTNFENCVADVNIPLGEVFTSPVLKGTSGVLHVGSVYIGEIQYRNLELVFQDGMIVSYACENFETEEDNKTLIKQQILKNHKTLPMGEFAIGTNTTAYEIARRFGIIEKLPILIVEKMGPHFAVGDTCYSWSEDSPVFNPDGKEIIARENEISARRKENVSEAYFGCHTDITIPYSELGRIAAVKEDGTQIPIIEEGRFVLPGTEMLNEALDRAAKKPDSGIL